MEFRTVVPIERAPFQIEPLEEMLFVGSCFADSIGSRFVADHFRATVNPFGTMYNPVSVLHTVQRSDAAPQTAVITLGTNHVYRLKETGVIVDNCQKRPASLFTEEELTIEMCSDVLCQTIDCLRSRRPDVRVIITVSPIRYRKYGYHESQLSKATLLLAVDSILPSLATHQSQIIYFPAYEILMDELRDYRFYAADMLHPSEQAVDYVWERLVEWCFNDEAKAFMDEWRPLHQALHHRPLYPESEEYQQFMLQTQERLKAFQKKWEMQ